MPLADNVAAMLADLPEEAGSDPESPEATPLPAASGSEPAATVVETDDKQAKRELLAAKLADIRERQQARALERQARGHVSKAKEDADAAAAERAKWEGLRTGTFVDGMRALGKDPREVLEQMKTEALKAGTPEFQISQMQERFDAELKRAISEHVEPLKKTIEQLTTENAEKDAAALDSRFGADFERTVQVEDFRALRVEYGEDRLFSMVRGFLASPKTLVTNAKALGVDLTHQDGRFSMREALTVLRRAQEEHEAQKQRRAQAVATPNPAGQGAPEKRPKVNGTVEVPSNPLGNTPASSRASGAPVEPRLSRRERVQRLADEDGG